MTRTRLTADARREQIIAMALELSYDKPYWKVTRNEIAEAVGVAGSVIQHHFGTVAELRRQIMVAAVAAERLDIIAQGIVARDPVALAAPDGLRVQAVASLCD